MNDDLPRDSYLLGLHARNINSRSSLPEMFLKIFWKTFQTSREKNLSRSSVIDILQAHSL